MRLIFKHSKQQVAAFLWQRELSCCPEHLGRLGLLGNKHGYGAATEQEVAKVEKTLAIMSDLLFAIK